MTQINELPVMLLRPCNIKNTDRKMNRKANASAKSKELQLHPQADKVAAHLLLPNRTTTFSL